MPKRLNRHAQILFLVFFLHFSYIVSQSSSFLPVIQHVFPSPKVLVALFMLSPAPSNYQLSFTTTDFTPSGKWTDLLCVFSTRALLLQGSICQTRDSKTCTPSFGRKHVWSGGWGKVKEGGDDSL